MKSRVLENLPWKNHCHTHMEMHGHGHILMGRKCIRTCMSHEYASKCPGIFLAKLQLIKFAFCTQATSPGKPQLEPISDPERVSQYATPPAAPPVENNGERETPSLMAKRGAMKGSDSALMVSAMGAEAAPLVSVKGIGPRSTFASRVSLASSRNSFAKEEGSAAKARVGVEGTSLYPHMTQAQAQAALRAAQVC